MLVLFDFSECLRGLSSEDAMGGWKKEGGWKTSRMTPLPKRALDPPRTVRFPPPSGVSALFFLYKNPRQSRPEAPFGGVQEYSGERVLWYVLSFKERSLQCEFWPQNSQILIWILLWIFGWIFSSCFFPRKKAQKNQKIPYKILLGNWVGKFPLGFLQKPFLDKPPKRLFLRLFCGFGGNCTKVSKRVVWRSAKKPPKILKNVKNTPKSPILESVWLFSALSGPEGAESPVNGRSGCETCKWSLGLRYLFRLNSIKKRPEPQICPKFVPAIVFGGFQSGDQKFENKLSKFEVRNLQTNFDKFFQNFDPLTGTPKNNRWDKFWTNLGVRGVFECC